jgi:hypothetical protein
VARGGWLGASLASRLRAEPVSLLSLRIPTMHVRLVPYVTDVTLTCMGSLRTTLGQRALRGALLDPRAARDTGGAVIRACLPSTPPHGHPATVRRCTAPLRRQRERALASGDTEERCGTRPVDRGADGRVRNLAGIGSASCSWHRHPTAVFRRLKYRHARSHDQVRDTYEHHGLS